MKTWFIKTIKQSQAAGYEPLMICAVVIWDVTVLKQLVMVKDISGKQHESWMINIPTELVLKSYVPILTDTTSLIRRLRY